MIVVTVFLSKLLRLFFLSKSKGKLSPRSYPIQCERKWKHSFLSSQIFQAGGMGAAVAKPAERLRQKGGVASFGGVARGNRRNAAPRQGWDFCQYVSERGTPRVRGSHWESYLNPSVPYSAPICTFRVSGLVITQSKCFRDTAAPRAVVGPIVVESPDGSLVL